MNFITKHELYSSRDIKEEAKAQLKGNWQEVIFLSLIPTLFTIFFIQDANQSVANQNVGVDFLNLLMRIVQSFLATSVSFTLLDFIRTREKIEPLKGAVQAFQGRYFMNLLLLKILVNVYTFLWMLLFIVPGIVKSYSYSQAERIFKDTVDQTGEVPSPSACIKESQEMIFGHRLDLFTLDLSFIGWWFAALLTFGIGFIWLTPYMEMSRALFYENLRVKYSNEQPSTINEQSAQVKEEVGKDPDDFSDFADF